MTTRGATSRGFTFVEMMVVLAIVALVAAVAVPAIDAGLDSREVRRAIRQIAATMHHLRGEAVATGQHPPPPHQPRAERHRDRRPVALGDPHRARAHRPRRRRLPGDRRNDRGTLLSQRVDERRRHPRLQPAGPRQQPAPAAARSARRRDPSRGRRLMRRRAAGFTLIEIAVAMAILGAGVVTLQQIYQGALRLQERSSRRSRVVLHARARDGRAPRRARREGPHRGASRRARASRRACSSAMRRSTRAARTPEATFDLHSLSEQKLRYLEVEVAWSGRHRRKTYTLRSLRMAPERGGSASERRLPATRGARFHAARGHRSR